MASSETTPTESEQSPLRGSTEPTATLYHRDSIFSLCIFLPPLTRKANGHYCTLPVIVAFTLLVFTVTCQLSLTLIAGRHIQDGASSFKVSLVQHERWRATGVTPMDFLWETVRKQKELAVSMWNPADAPSECCDAAECVELNSCCDASGKLEKRKRQQSNWTSQYAESQRFLDGGMSRPPNANSTRFKKLIDSFAFRGGEDVAVCRKGSDNVMDCTPPSYAYLDAWHELDDNGDGLWSSKEADADRTNLGCRLGLSTKDFFNSAVRGIIKDARDTADNSYAIPLVPSSIENREAIPKEYFEHFKGLVVLCTAFDIGRCGQMIKDGFFDGAIGLQSRAARGGIHDLDSALDFCQRMLRPHGVCEQVLPHTFQIYASRMHEKCGAPSYEVTGKYTNPYNPRDAMSIVNVGYSEYDSYEAAHHLQFQSFLFLILLVWYVTLVLELSRILELWDLLRNMKSAEEGSYARVPAFLQERIRSLGSLRNLSGSSLTAMEAADSSEKMSGTRSFYTAGISMDDRLVDSISRPHLIVCKCMLYVRIFLWFYMGNVGTAFLLATFAYDDLLFNAVALAFIFELPEFLYSFLIADEIKESMDGAKSIAFPTSLPTSGWMAVLISRAFWGIAVIPFLVFVVLSFNYRNNILQSLEALNCACFQRGPNCIAAIRFSSSWWDQYWKDTFPLAKLRSSYLS